MNVRGFWNKEHARRPWKIQGELRDIRPATVTEQETWRTHPDRDAVKRAEVALCTLPKVARHDS